MFQICRPLFVCVSTLLLGAGDSCNQGALLSIPHSLGAVEQVWLILTAIDGTPMEFDSAWTKQGNGTSTSGDPGKGLIKNKILDLILNTAQPG